MKILMILLLLLNFGVCVSHLDDLSIILNLSFCICFAFLLGFEWGEG